MKEKFSSTMVTCAAIATFLGSGAAIVNGFSSIMDYKVGSVLVAREQAAVAAKLAADSESGMIDSVVTGVKKLGKVLN